MKPRVGITTWRRELPTFLDPRTLLYTLGDEYVRAVADAGAVPLLLPHLAGPDDVAAVLDVVDGLLVAGGGDVDPDSYGGPPEVCEDVDPAADRSEVALLREAAARRLPTLAICRGMQVMAVAAGARLHPDIGTPGAVHEPVPKDDPAAVMAARHRVDIVPGSRLADVLGAGERTVNSIHHQAVADVPAGYRVTATAPDGVVEALEPEGDWPAIGVQWHPEKLDGADAPLFDWLVTMSRTVTVR